LIILHFELHLKLLIMSSEDGQSLHSLLTSIGAPSMEKLSPDGLDWLFENDSCLPFLKWFVAQIDSSNVVDGKSLEEFSLLPKESILPKKLLTAALKICDNKDNELTDKQLEEQISGLEHELGLQTECRDKLEAIKERIGDQAIREQAKAGQIDHLIERAEKDERRKQEELLATNTSYNESVKNLASSVKKLSEIYESATEDDEQNPKFISSISLAKICKADAQLEKELRELMDLYFSNTADEDELCENTAYSSFKQLNDRKGRTQKEYEFLIKEIERISVSFCDAELAKIKYQAEEACWQESYRLSNNEVVATGQRDKQCEPSKRIKPALSESLEMLEEEIKKLILQLSRLNCQEILTADHRRKIKKNEKVIERLEEVKDILLQQVARKEILSIALNMEISEVEIAKELLESTISDLKKEISQSNNFKAAMKSLGGHCDDRNLISSEDKVMMGVYKVLLNHGLVGHIATYSGVKEAVNKLEQRHRYLDEQIEKSKLSWKENLETRHSQVLEIVKILNIKEGIDSPKNIALSPLDIINGISALESCLGVTEKNAKKLMDRWEKEKTNLKNKPYLRIQRDIWIDFLVKPKVLLANVKSLSNKMKD